MRSRKRFPVTRRTLCGSAIVWVVSVLAILIIFLLSAVTASMVYATRVSKESLNSQMKYTAQSAADILIDKYCTANIYSAAAQSDLDKISVGSSAGPIVIEFNSPEPLNPMGECKAYISRPDDNTAVINVTASYENLASEGMSAVLKKESVFEAGFICTNSLNFGIGSSLTLDSGVTAVLQNSLAEGDGIALYPIIGSGGNVIYSDKDPLRFDAISISPALSNLVVGFDMPLGKYKQVNKNDSLTESGEYKYNIKFDYTGGMTIEGGKEYYFKIPDNKDVTLDLDISKNGTDASVIYIDMGKSNSTINIISVPDDVLLYTSGENGEISIETGTTHITGALSAGNFVFNDGANVTLTYAPPDKVMSVSADNIDTYMWKFVQYAQPQE